MASPGISSQFLSSSFRVTEKPVNTRRSNIERDQCYVPSSLITHHWPIAALRSRDLGGQKEWLRSLDELKLISTRIPSYLS
jgi:hypothetical protein